MNPVSASLKAVSNVLMRRGTVCILNLDQLCYLTTVAVPSTIGMSCLLWFFEVIVSLFSSLRLSKFDKLGPHSKRCQSVYFCNLLPHPGKAYWDPSQRKHAVCATSPVPWQVCLRFSLPDKCTGDLVEQKKKEKGKIFFIYLLFFLLSCEIIIIRKNS